MDKKILVVFLLFLFTRLIKLFEMPIFIDEALYLYWVKQIQQHLVSPFVSLTYGLAPFYIWVLTVVTYFLKKYRLIYYR